MMIKHLLVSIGLMLNLVSIINAANINIALLYESDRTDILAVATSALQRFNNDVSLNQGHQLVKVNFPIVNYNRYAVIQQMCNESTVYAAIVDLTIEGGACSSLQLAEQLDAAYITIMGERCYDYQTFSVRFNNMAYFDSLSRVVLGQNESRHAVAMFFDYTFDIGPILPMQNVPWFVPTFLFEIPATKNATQALLTSVQKETSATEFVVVASATNASYLLEQATKLNINTGIYHWYVFTRDFEAFTCASCYGNDVIHMQHVINNQTLYNDIKTLVGQTTFDQLNHGVLDLFYAFEAVITMGSVLAPLVNTAGWNSSTPSLSCYQPTPPRLNFFPVFQSSLMQYSYKYPGVVSNVAFNNRTSSNGVSFAIERCRLNNCTDTLNRYVYPNDILTLGPVNMTYQTIPHYKILVLEEPPFVYINWSMSNLTFDGYAIRVLDYLSSHMNFTYSIALPQDRSYGILQPDGTWSGIIGEMANGYADIALGAITITAERETVVDFSIPYYDYAGLQIVLSNQDSSNNNDMFYFLTVFEGWVWLCIGLTLILTGILVTVFDRLSPYSFQNKTVIKEGEPEGKIFTFKESMWFVLGAYTQAGESFDPRATSTRMLVAGFWLFSCIMMAMYTANLAAFLTVTKLATSITSVEQLADQTDTMYSVQANTAGQTFFMRMRDIETNFYNIWKNISVGDEYTVSDVAKYSVWEYPILERYTDMYNRMEKWGFPNTTQQALDLIHSKHWAIFMETPFIKYYMSKDCTLTNTGEILSSKPYGIVLQNKSPLTSIVNMMILQMQSDRILENLKVEWWSKEQVTCPTVDNNAGITIQTLGGVFIFLAGGIVLGGLVLIGEIIVAKTIGVQKFLPDEENLKCNQPKPALGPHQHHHPMSSSLSVRLHSPRPVIPRGSISASRKNSEVAVMQDTSGHLVLPSGGGAFVNHAMDVEKL